MRFSWQAIQRSKHYWRARAGILRAWFYFGRGLFRLRSKVTEFRTSFRVAAALTYSVLVPAIASAVVAFAAEYAGRIIERKTVGTSFGSWLTKLQATQAYVSPFLGTILQVLAPFIGLYFTAISIVASTVYASAPSRIRRLILEDKVSNVYVRGLVLTATLCAYVFAAVSLGAHVSILTVVVIAVFLVLCVSSFWSLGLRAFHFFDPAALAAQLTANVTQWMTHASATGFRWLDQSFQNYYRKQVQELLRDFGALAEVAGKGRGSPLVVFANLSQLLGWYAEKKMHIPSDSYWFRRERRHRGWFSADDSAITLALNTGTPLHADEPPNLNWFEEDILDIFREHWRILSQESGSVVPQFIDHLRSVVGVMCESYAVDEANLVIKATSEIAEEHSRQLTGSLGVPGQPNPPIEALMVVQALGLSTIEATLGFRRGLAPLTATCQRAVALARSERWAQFFSLRLPRAVASDAEIIARKLAFERSVEDKLISPEWYVVELLSGSAARFLGNGVEGILKSFDLALATAQRWMKEKRYLAAAHASVSGLEGINKFRHMLGALDETIKALEQHKTQLGLQWPSIDQPALERRLQELHLQFALVLADSAANAPLIALGGVFPDYLGQAFNVCFDIAFDALLDGDEKVFAQCTPRLFVLGGMADERLRPKSTTPYELSVATVPMTMLMELSAYAFVLSPVHGKNFGHAVHRLWDLHTARFANPAVELERLAAILSYRRAQLMTIMHGDVQRTGRERRVEQMLTERGLIRDPYDHRRHAGGTVQTQQIPPVIRALEGTLSIHHIVDVFAAVYLLGHGVDRKKVPRQARDLADRLQRETGLMVAEDEEEDGSA